MVFLELSYIALSQLFVKFNCVQNFVNVLANIDYSNLDAHREPAKFSTKTYNLEQFSKYLCYENG